MSQPREALPGAILWRWHWNTIANSPCYKDKERIINQSICGEILEYGAPMSKWHDTVYTSRDLLPHPANHPPNSNRSNSKSHLEVTSLIRWMSRRHSCKSKSGRLQEHVALNLLGNKVIWLLWLSRSTVTSEQSKSFHRYLSSLWNKNPLEVHHILLQTKKYYPWSSSTIHLWSKKYS